MKSQAHKIRMQEKKDNRDFWFQRLSRNSYVPANLGVNHPDYGMTMEQHLKAKAKRNAEKSS